MKLDFSSFNPSQLAAVAWQDGPILVLAGPGSGKTRVLTYRIARLIQESPGARFRVLGITFTNKAATEMRTRIDTLLFEGRDRAQLTTFHAFAAEILRQHGSHIGLKPDFSILTEQAEREAVLTEAIRAAIPSDLDLQLKASQVLPVVARLFDQCIAPQSAEELLGKYPHASAIAKIYSHYRNSLITANQLDFPSLLAFAVELLESRPSIAKQMRRIFSYLCVDEFQDTNTAQSRLLSQLAEPVKPNLFVVADDDQVIYQWNGASPARIQEIRERYDMNVLQLPENYRCPPAVIDLANHLIQNNSDRSAGKLPLTAHKPTASASQVRCLPFATFDQEINWIAQDISGRPASERAHCVILARRRKLLDDAVVILTGRGVPAYVAVRKNEFESAPYRWLHGMLRLANSRQDREQLRRVSKAFFDLEGIKIEVDDVVALASIDERDYARAWLDAVEQRANLESHTVQMTKHTRAQLIDRLDFVAFIESCHNWFSILRQASPSTSEGAFDEFDDETEIWNGLVNDIKQHSSLSEISLHAFLHEIDLRAKEKPAAPGAVRCLSIHASKGMEFQHVYVIGLAEEELPSWAATKKGSDSAEMREERRSCFVAITRAEDTLTLTYAKVYQGHMKRPSRFLREMGVLS